MRVVTPHDHVTEKVIAALYKVHGVLKSGFAEKVYENSLCVELRKRGLSFERQKAIRIYYEGEDVGDYVADLVVEGVVLVELKALRAGLDDDHMAQTINYMTCLRLPVGLLTNFGRSLEFKRLLNTDLLPPPSNT